MTTHTIENVSACEKRITITVDVKKVKKAMQAKEREHAGKVNYGGFRANSAVTKNLVKVTPQEIQTIYQELCKKSFSEFAKKEKLNYQSTPMIDNIAPNEDGSLNYTVILENYPEISHVNWEGVALEKLETEITDESLADAEPFFKKMGFVSPMESKDSATQWSKWMIEIFQRQKIRDQVIESLLKQNTVSELPLRVIEERYQELKAEYQKEETFDEAALRETATKYITTDILFKAYGLEHKISVTQETFVEKVKEASQNPFIMGHLQDQSLLPYYLAPRIIEDSIIDHLVENAECSTQMIPLKDFMALAFNQSPEENSSESELEILESPETENTTQQEETE